MHVPLRLQNMSMHKNKVLAVPALDRQGSCNRSSGEEEKRKSSFQTLSACTTLLTIDFYPSVDILYNLSTIMANTAPAKTEGGGDPMAGLVHSEAHYFNRYTLIALKMPRG